MFYVFQELLSGGKGALSVWGRDLFKSAQTFIMKELQFLFKKIVEYIFRRSCELLDLSIFHFEHSFSKVHGYLVHKTLFLFPSLAISVLSRNVLK